MNRVDFAEKELKLHMWPGFAGPLAAADNGTQFIALRSCNGAGKTTLLSAFLAYEFARLDALADTLSTLTIVLSSSTASQLKGSLFKECLRRIKGSRFGCSATATEIKRNENQFAICITPARIESSQGFHSDRVVVLIDEASGLDHDKLKGLLSNATGDCLVVTAYNPLNSDAAVFEIEQSGNWMTFEISAFDHPNVTEGMELIPGAVTRRFVDSVLAISSLECNEHLEGAIHTPWDGRHWMPTPEALARVCGKWSVEKSQGLIQMRDLLDCCKPDIQIRSGMRVGGCDIAASGDDRSTLSIFYGNQNIQNIHWQTGDLSTITSHLAAAVTLHGLQVLCIDDTGVGRSITERLREMPSVLNSCLLIPINFGQAPRNIERFRRPANARAEMYLNLEREVRSREIQLIYEIGILKELAAARTVPSKGDTLRLEDKRFVKRRLGRSPDYADAIALARYATKIFMHFSQKRLL